MNLVHYTLMKRTDPDPHLFLIRTGTGTGTQF